MGQWKEMVSGVIQKARNMLEDGKVTKLMAMEFMLLRRVITKVFLIEFRWLQSIRKKWLWN